jgi:general L-amino acid transport system permease protein
MSDAKSYEPGHHPSLPPPKNLVGWRRWVWDNLFGTVTNTILTLLSIYLLYLILPGILNYFIFDAVVNASSRAECAELGSGACWAFIGDRFSVFIYGFYPDELRWRPNLTFILLIVALIPVLYDNTPFRKYGLYFSLAFPIIAAILMVGGVFGLEAVDTRLFGGVLLTIIIGVTGITFSLPLGIVLALGRYSNLPAIKVVCTVFIEFIRGVPLITLLFVASTMLSYFLPPGTNFDLLLRVLIMVTLFASAYMAEVIRGGLQSLPKGQFEAADAMGLKYWQTMRLIILPQALKISIPGIVNTFIGLYKDTTLVIVIGMLDVLGVAKSAVSDPVWNGLSVEIYVFVAAFFFVCCFGMSRYSMYLENKLHTGHKR